MKENKINYYLDNNRKNRFDDESFSPRHPENENAISIFESFKSFYLDFNVVEIDEEALWIMEDVVKHYYSKTIRSYLDRPVLSKLYPLLKGYSAFLLLERFNRIVSLDVSQYRIRVLMYCYIHFLVTRMPFNLYIVHLDMQKKEKILFDSIVEQYPEATKRHIFCRFVHKLTDCKNIYWKDLKHWHLLSRVKIDNREAFYVGIDFKQTSLCESESIINFEPLPELNFSKHEQVNEEKLTITYTFNK